jgi:DNA mismatch repair protein MutS2
MESAVLKKLEFDKVAAYASGFCLSAMGRDRLLEYRRPATGDEIRNELGMVLELKNLLAEASPLPFSHLPDTRNLLRKLDTADAWLDPEELLDIFFLLRSSVQLRKFMFGNREVYPSLNDFTIRLWLEKSLQYAITQVVDEKGRIRDTASDGLYQIREDLGEGRARLSRSMERILKRCQANGWLMEDTVALKNGRLVLGLRAEYKYKLPGYVQDYSQTGQTVFIEPAETLEISNRIQELEIAERREIERILKSVSAQIRTELDNIRHNEDILAGFDSLYARARIAIETASVYPSLSSGPELRIVGGLHPWLLISHLQKKEKIFPLDLELCDGEQALVISGPNAGGKSVAMKTVGLLSCMLLHGYLLPCSESSVFPLFNDLFIEIGDDQSIENDLSTFSSHLASIKEILSSASSGSLVLIDELCSGTDVEEGGAIARAIIEELLERSVKTIVTTHLGELKVYAHERQGVVNGAMEFDREGLVPTFRFLKGLPGNSFAFAMLQRMGFPASVLARASGFMKEGPAGIEQMLDDLKSLLEENRVLQLSLSRERTELEGFRSALLQDRAVAQRLKHELETRGYRQMQQEVEHARKEIRVLMKEVKEHPDDRHALLQAREKLSGKRSELSSAAAGLEAAASAAPADSSIRPGDLVRLLDSRTTGEVEALQGDSAVVRCGNFRITTALKGVEKISKTRERKISREEGLRPGEEKWTVHASDVTSNRLDLRGLTGDDAVNETARFIDSLQLHRIFTGVIIHGKGSGALRQRIAGFLKQHRHVKGFRLGDWSEGGAGVTIIELQ